jgi:hypothetical protein
MKYIAHRGLIDGPNKNFENHPHKIRTSLAKGFDCEIDLWVVDGRLYLGHDEPMYSVTEEFIQTPGLWIHAKSLTTLTWLTESAYTLNYFWHQTDDYTLTSSGYIWAYPGKFVNARSVMVMPETADPTLSICKDVNCYGICSDWVEKIKSMH